MSTAEKYIRVEDNGTSASGLTKRWVVRNIRSGENCGEIRWHGPFRGYCFFPTDGFLFDASCLHAIAEHLEGVNSAKRKAKAGVR